MLLKVDQLTKTFPGVRALNQVSLQLNKGEVLSVIGENGAGKSTLMKILAGVQKADSGFVYLDEKEVEFDTTRDAMGKGIILIHQELNLCENLTIAQNIFLGHELNRYGFINRSTIKNKSTEFLKRVGLDLSPSTMVGNLTIGKQQMVEIAKALSHDARVLIMDEPTSSLSSKESESLFQLIEALKEQGVSIIYISHRLGEVIRLSDRVTVLRDGENAGELVGDEITHQNMVKLMVGRDLTQLYARNLQKPGDEILRIEDVVTTTWPKHKVSLSVSEGEIVGVAGLVGAGRTELLETIFGVSPRVSGEVFVSGKSTQIHSPVDAIANDIALVPEDRKNQGLVIEATVRNNIGLAGLRRFQKGIGFANLSLQKSQSKEMCDRLNVKTPSDRKVVKFLSGGNQQKVVIGKWLAMSPKLLMVDEPTRGIDIGAKQEIYQLMDELVSQKIGILVVSSELEEIMGISDRIVVMHEGKLMGELARKDFSEQAIINLATGISN